MTTDSKVGEAPVAGIEDVTTIVVMGVSGSGKTTVAKALVETLGWEYAEGDDFHPPANVEKMHSGHALTDEDRWPWLRAIADWIGEHERAGRSTVVTCSALRRVYRDLLRDGHPSVFFAHVQVSRGVLEDRLGHRRGHYMPASLLSSQLATLEPLEPDEPGCTLPGDATVEEVRDEVLAVVGTAESRRAELRDPARGAR